MGDQAKIKKERFDGTQVEVLGETYDPGQTPMGAKYNWEERLGTDQKDLVMFLKTGLRYWYSNDWFGSEKRKNPA